MPKSPSRIGGTGGNPAFSLFFLVIVVRRSSFFFIVFHFDSAGLMTGSTLQLHNIYIEGRLLNGAQWCSMVLSGLVLTTTTGFGHTKMFHGRSTSYHHEAGIPLSIFSWPDPLAAVSKLLRTLVFFRICIFKIILNEHKVAWVI